MIDIEAAGGSHKRSCVMLYLPKDMAQRLVKWGNANIPDEWLAADGREDEPHVTVLYGIKTQERSEVEGFFPKGPVEVEMGAVSRFDTNEEFDVVKVDVEGDGLSELHYAMAEGVENDDSHPVYHAHATIAYVKKGKGKELDGAKIFGDKKVKLTDLVWSPAGEGEDRKEHIDLAHRDRNPDKVSRSWLWSPWMQKMADAQKDIDPEFAKVIDDNFWELL